MKTYIEISWFFISRILTMFIYILITHLSLPVKCNEFQEIINSTFNKSDFQSVIYFRIGESNLEPFALSIPMITINLVSSRFYFKKEKESFSYPKPAARFEKLGNITYPFLKFTMNSKFLVIFEIEWIYPDKIEIFNKLLNLNKHVKILIKAPIILIPEILQQMYEKGFINIVATDFFNIFTYEIFPEFHIQEIENIYFSNKVHNIKGHIVPISIYNNSNRAIIYENNSQTQYGGYLVWFFRTFVKYLNGTPQFQVEPKNLLGGMEKMNSGTSEFVTGFNALSSLDLMSNSLLILHWGFIAPVPEEINREYYIFKPFHEKVWIFNIILIIVVPIVLRIFLKGTDLWNHINLLIKAFISQSFKYSKKTPRIIVSVFLISGFLTSLFYTTLLGSFLTTIVYEKPVNAFQELRNLGYHLFVVEHEYEVLLKHLVKVESNKEIFKPIELINFWENIYNLNNSNAYGIASETWDNVIYNLQNFYNIKKFFWVKNFLGSYPSCIHRQRNSVYEKELNRFIGLSLDHGLMQYWYIRAFLELKSAKLMKYNIEEKVRVLNLRYFMFIFYLLFLGIALSFIVFVFENVLFRKYKKFKF